MWRVDVELRGRVVEQRGTKSRGKPREWSSTDQVLQATSSEAAPVSLEAQAHAKPDRQKLRLYAGEDAGSDLNVHTYTDLRKDSKPPVRRVVHAPLFFPLREVHTVPSVWLSLNRFTTSHAGTVRELPVPESEK